MKPTKKYILAIMLGLVVGVLTLTGQKYLPMNLNFLANSGAVWLIPAFLLSYFGKGNRLQAIVTTIWRAMIFPERRLFRSVSPRAAVLVPAQTIFTFFVPILQ